MKPPAFEYFAPESLEEAVALLARHGDDAKLLAGGQSLVAMLNFRLLSPAVIVDINRIPELDQIEERASGLRIGALTRHHRLEMSEAVHARFPVLTAAMAHVAHLAIRNRGTLGGSLAHGDPAAELPMIAVLLEARITATGSGGEREIEAGRFFSGALATVLRDDEIITRIDLPVLAQGTGWGFEEFARRAGDFGLAGAAATVTLSGTRAREVRIALLGVDATPVRAREAEAILVDTEGDGDSLDAAILVLRASITPGEDLHASPDYRRHLAGVLAKRALTSAWARAAP